MNRRNTFVRKSFVKYSEERDSLLRVIIIKDKTFGTIAVKMTGTLKKMTPSLEGLGVGLVVESYRG